MAGGFAVGDGPEGDAAGEVGGDDALGIVGEAGAQGELAGGLEVAELAAFGVPKGDEVVAVAGDQAARASSSSWLEAGLLRRTSSTGSMTPRPRKCAQTMLTTLRAKKGLPGAVIQRARTSRRIWERFRCR